MIRPEIGSQLGNYKLVSFLGAGGFAYVYLGEHIYLPTRAAIKVLHFSPGFSSEELSRFFTEARTIAKLRHPHIVSVLDFGVENDLPYLVMENAPQGSLGLRHPRGSVLPLSTIVRYVNQVASALQYAHAHKVIHCDVKPENMLIGENGEVLLSDFGIAKVVQNTPQTQDAVGTIYYMAPEQFIGKPVPASDQYALGVVVYLWLSGQFPFNGSNAVQILVKHTYAPPPSLQELVRTIPPDVEAVVFKALAKDPSQRFSSVQDFAAAFEMAVEESTPRRGVLWSPPPRPSNVSPAEMAPSPTSQAPARGNGKAPTTPEESDVAGEAFPLLPRAIDSLPPSANLRGEPTEPMTTETPEKPEKPSFSQGVPHWSPFSPVPPTPDEPDGDVFQQEIVDVDDADAMQLLPSSALLLSMMANPPEPGKDVQEQNAPVRAEVPVVPPDESSSPSQLLRSITSHFRERQEMGAIEDKPTILIPPASSEPEPVLEEDEPTIRAHPLQVTPRDFFISYDLAELGWARWVARILTEAGYSVVPVKETAQAGIDVEAEMELARGKADHVIALISRNYVHARKQSDWTAIFRPTQAGEASLALPVCVQACNEPFVQILHTTSFINLMGLTLQAAKDKLVEGIHHYMFPGTIPLPALNSPQPDEPTPVDQQIKIFISYSHSDKRFRDQLLAHLVPIRLVHETVTSWDDRAIQAGEDIDEMIKKNLEQSHIVIFLVSANFIASSYCREKELGPALKRHQEGAAHVIPVILEHCQWRKTPLGRLNALPKDGKPLRTIRDRSKALKEVAEGVERVIEEMKKKLKIGVS